MMDIDGMSVITVKKAELLTVLKENMAKHRAVFEDASAGYREEAIKIIEAMLEDARKGKAIRQSVNLIQPIDQTRDYARVIRMLEMHVGDEMKISEHEFAQYVQDDWSWKGQFVTSTASYVGKAGKR